MRCLKSVLLAVLSLSSSILGCDKILGIEEKHYDSNVVPYGAGGEGGTGGEGGASATETCSLVTGKNASLRIMNAIPTTAILDLCAKPSGVSNAGDPWFMASKGPCGKGVGYTQYTTDLGIDEGTYDFKLISAGDNCSASGIERSSVSIAEGDSVTLLTYGSDLDNGELSILMNRKPVGLDVPLRFVHALNIEGNLTAGLSNSTTTPAKFISSIFTDVSFGGVATESSGGPTSIDDVLADGYTLYGVGEKKRTVLNLGISIDDNAELALVAPLSVSSGHAYTFFALGVSGSIEQRPRLWTCDETVSDGLFFNCGNPVNISFEVFNPNLADAFTSFVVERKLPATRAIVAENTDVLCVAELFQPEIKELVKVLGSPHFDYRVFSDDIPENERGALPLRQDGNPPEYNPTACPGELSGLLDTFLQCGIKNQCLALSDNAHYVAKPGDSATNCFYANCLAEGAAVMMYSDATGVIPDGQGVACYMCELIHLASYESSESTYAACTTDSAKPAHLAYGGTTGLAVLSKYPLGKPELVLLPSTGWQRAVMRVPVTLPNGAVVDHWCGSLRFPNTEAELFYAGQYGLGNTGETGVLIEQQYGIQTLVEAVQKQRNKTGTPALVGLVTYTSPTLTDKNDNILVYPQAAESYAKLDAVWPRLVADNYVPACTYCGDANVNPLNAAGKTSSFWSTHLFAEGISTDQVQSTERTFTEQTVSGILEVRTPVSQHFGLRSVITLTQ